MHGKPAACSENDHKNSTKNVNAYILRVLNFDFVVEELFTQLVTEEDQRFESVHELYNSQN